MAEMVRQHLTGDFPNTCCAFIASLLLMVGNAFALPAHAPVPGGIAVLGLTSTSATAPVVRFNDIQQPVVRQHEQWVVLIGIPLDTVAGRQQAAVEDGGRKFELAFEVLPKNYPTQRLRIPDGRMVQPPPEVEARIAMEQQKIAAMKRHFSPQPVPETDFVQPAAGRLSSRFGVRRILNGEPRSPHAGLDVAVGTGAPVLAAASGSVLAVEDFYFTGNTVVIDHGQGVLTLYAHLSRVDVQPGQLLGKGKSIGTSGVSGRATGPHLHWVVILGGASVDPELFLPKR
jgi:murein DD-endopeptidase MepM/ murein hydrolase activator NlpD